MNNTQTIIYINYWKKIIELLKIDFDLRRRNYIKFSSLFIYTLYISHIYMYKEIFPCIYSLYDGKSPFVFCWLFYNEFWY
jgi:hypothetical protein